MKITIILSMLFLLFLSPLLGVSNPNFETKEIEVPSLNGNLLGDSSTREISIYLPPSYESSTNKYYPTIYLLHGYTGDNRYFISNHILSRVSGGKYQFNIGVIADSLISSGEINETIIVMPNALNLYGGSWFERSEVMGDYRTYIANDLVNYIDDNYRTIRNRNSRGIGGHSMGGYGAISLAMEYPDVFGAVAALSPGIPNDLNVNPTVIEKFISSNPSILGNPMKVRNTQDTWNMLLTKFDTNILYSLAVAYTPNVNKPPYFVDLPIQYPDKTIITEVWEKWREFDLVHQIARHGSKLSNTPIYIDEGIGETVFSQEVPGISNTLAALDEQNIPYKYVTFDGDHMTHLNEQTKSALLFLNESTELTSCKEWRLFD